MKTTNKLMAILLTLVLSISVLALAGCSSTPAEPKETLSGKYILSTFTTPDGEEFGKEEIEAVLVEEDQAIENSFYFEFFEDETCELAFEGEKTDATYKKDGDSVTVYADGDEVVIPISGSQLIWTLEDTVMVYEKQ